MYDTPVTTTTSLDTATAATTFMIIWLIAMALGILMIVCLWKIFTKAGKPGWASIVPIYNYVVLLEIIGRPIWWIILFFVPIVNLVIYILIYLELAASFGKSALFAIIGLMFFPYVGFPMLAFGSATYVGPAGGGTPQLSPSVPVAPTPPPATV